MSLKDLQQQKLEFDKERSWDKFRASNIFVHLIEELGEIGRHICYEEGYKKDSSGQTPNISHEELKREFAQVLMLFLQLANHYSLDLEEVFKKEMEIAKERFKKS